MTHSVCHYQYQQFSNFLHWAAFCLKYFAPFPPFLPSTVLSHMYICFIHILKNLHTQYTNLHPHSNPVLHAYLQIYVFVHVYVFVCVCVCLRVCACLHAYTYVTNVQRQGGEQSVNILIQAKISWKTIAFQYKCALKHIYSLSKIYPFLLLFQWYSMFYWTTFLVDVTPLLG